MLSRLAGNLNSNGNQLLIYGKQFGNVFIGVQPTFGYEGDPMRLLFSRSASPHHGFAAYYTFLEKIFKVRCMGSVGSMQHAGSFRIAHSTAERSSVQYGVVRECCRLYSDRTRVAAVSCRSTWI